MAWSNHPCFKRSCVPHRSRRYGLRDSLRSLWGKPTPPPYAAQRERSTHPGETDLSLTTFTGTGSALEMRDTRINPLMKCNNGLWDYFVCRTFSGGAFLQCQFRSVLVCSPYLEATEP